MKSPFSPNSKADVAKFILKRPLLVFDYDGTLAPIVSDTDKAFMRASTKRLLIQLSRVAPVAVITGRSRMDVAKFLKGVRLRGIVGNHGYEGVPGENKQALRKLKKIVGSWIPEFASVAKEFPGTWVESKGFSLSVHYRDAKDGAKVRAALIKRARDLKVPRSIEGKGILNVLPSKGVHKGTGLAGLMRGLKFSSAVFLGDDLTDEFAFALRKKRKILTVKVGPKKRSHAEYFMSFEDVDRFLSLLKALNRCS
jgi:trehalose 6-phosphate phosphatase